MPTRFRGSIRPWIYRYLCLRDGETCAICGKIPTCPITKKGMSKYLDIDHVDGNKKNNNDDNLRLLCRSCNVSESNRTRKKISRGVCVSKSDVVKKLVRYHEGTAEMSVADYCEPVFRSWVEETIDVVGHMDKSDVIASGAEVCGCSVTTATRYLAKLTSSAGMFSEMVDRTGKTVIIRRP